MRAVIWVIMSTLKDLTEAGKAIGLEGTELHTFIKDEQARERQEG